MFPIAYHPIYKYPVPDNHRFPMDKYELLPIQLVREGVAAASNFFGAEVVDMQAVLAVHDKAYIDRFMSGTLTAREMRRIGFAYSPALVERELRIANGTVQGAIQAFDTGIAFNIAGGTHHACRDHGEGFCMVNDQALAAQYLVDRQMAGRVLIVDLDVHQGNGTADIFRDEPRIFTFSVHSKGNYPFRKEKSDLDLELTDGTDDTTYLALLEKTLPKLIKDFQPDFIFYQAGVDILSTDAIGRMSCTADGCKRRDELVLSQARLHRIPVQCSMGGGYSPQLRTIIEAHMNTYRVAAQLF